MQDQLKMMQALGALMKNKDELKAAGERVKQRLATETVDAEVGGLRVTTTCVGVIRHVHAEPGALSGDDPGVVIREATNAALARARDRAKEIGKEEFGALNIPGLEDLMNRQAGGFADDAGGGMGGGIGGLGGLLG